MDKSKPELNSYRYTFHFFVLSFIIVIIYSNTIVQEWHFDDYPNIVHSKSIQWQDISFDSVKETFFSDGYGRNSIARPIPRLTFALNYYLSGHNTLSYHLTNIAIHIITAFFVYLVFQRTLIILKEKDEVPFTVFTCQDIALLGAVLWAIHPLQTQAVTYIVQRMASMAAMFYMMGMFFYIVGRLKSGKLKPVLFFGVAFICWVVAVLSKENAVMLPLSVIIYELIFFGFAKKKILYIFSLLSLLAFAAICIVIFTRGDIVGSIYEIYSSVEDKVVKLYAHRPFTMTERVLTESRILIWYLFLILCPISDFLSLESDIVISASLFQPLSTFTAILLILLLLFFSIYFSEKMKIISFAILFFFINHIVESTFIGLELYFEHRNYLSSIFIYLIFSYWLIRLYKYYYDNNKVIMYSLISLFIIGIIVSEGNATYLRNDVWHTEETLHRDNLIKAPNNIRPRISLSSYYMRKGKLDEAMELLQDAEYIVNSQTVRVQKNWIGLMYHNIGTYYYRKSDFEKSKSNLLKSLEYDQYSWETHILLGMLFFKEGDVERSVKAYTNAVNLHSSDPKLFNMFGRALYASNDLQMALEAFRKGLELAQDQQLYDLVKTIRFNMIACFLALDDIDNAKAAFRSTEKYFDDIIYKYSFYVQDRIGTSSLQEAVLYNDVTYLLYKSVIYPSENKETLQKLIDRLVNFGNEYCELISEIKDNKVLGVIYPSVNILDNDLSQLYYNRMKELVKTIEDGVTNSINCITADSNFVGN